MSASAALPRIVFRILGRLVVTQLLVPVSCHHSARQTTTKIGCRSLSNQLGLSELGHHISGTNIGNEFFHGGSRQKKTAWTHLPMHLHFHWSLQSSAAAQWRLFVWGLIELPAKCHSSELLMIESSKWAVLKATVKYVLLESYWTAESSIVHRCP